MALIRNIGRMAESVGIILSDGTKSTIRIMPRNKGVTIDTDERVDPRWMALHGQNIRVFDDATVVAAQLAASINRLGDAVLPTGSSTPVATQSTVTQVGSSTTTVEQLSTLIPSPSTPAAITN
jgi:hypothetical protein